MTIQESNSPGVTPNRPMPLTAQPDNVPVPDLIKNFIQSVKGKELIETFLDHTGNKKDAKEGGSFDTLSGTEATLQMQAALATGKPHAVEFHAVHGGNEASIEGITKSITTAFKQVSNPELPPADEKTTTDALMSALSSSKDKPPIQYNLFLGGLVSVALLEAMMEYMKTQQVAEKIASNMWLDVKSVLEDTAHAIAANIQEKAKVEAIEHIVNAACSAGACVLQFGCGIKGMSASKSSEGMLYNLMGQAGGTLMTGVLQNLAAAPLAIIKGGLDAEKVLLETFKDIVNTMMQKVKEMGDENAKTWDSFNEGLKGWLSQLSKIADKLSPH